ncbi:MAG: hypothetical protein U9O54_07575 [Chloroflexota bacterium]|nr:hypothetical protein [Chloroflexota bacterium]
MIMKRIFRWLRIVFTLLFLMTFLERSALNLASRAGQIQAYSRPLEFDHFSWMVGAMWNKVEQFSLGTERYISASEGSQFVLDYLDLVEQIFQLENEYQNIYSDPGVENPESAVADVKAQLDEKRARRTEMAPLVEELLQRQINASLADLGLTRGGQSVPPVLYQSLHSSYLLVISPRDEIRRDIDFTLIPNLTLEESIALEEDIEANLDVSALVTGIGGMGMYPSMIVETTSLHWLILVVSHEWTHNYLSLRPLGMHYSATPTMLVINETIADLSGYAIRDAVLERFYPEHVYVSVAEKMAKNTAEEDFLEAFVEMSKTHFFDFRHEMHKTRVVVDRMLADGEIEEAEAYMEERRQFFWEHGYHIRRLNQAYFAFHGMYAASPGGAVSGSANILGDNIRGLQDAMPSYASFMRKVAWMWREDQFEQAFEEYLNK